MKFVIDMNLSAVWVAVLEAHGWDAVHWSNVGAPTANDSEIAEWARSNERIVFTNDLDFGTILAMTGASAPSVLQVRTNQDMFPDRMTPLVVAAINQHASDLMTGSIVVVEEARTRVHVIPF